jgi:hypothetical protein
MLAVHRTFQKKIRTLARPLLPAAKRRQVRTNALGEWRQLVLTGVDVSRPAGSPTSARADYAEGGSVRRIPCGSATFSRVYLPG